jgi:hypothetical protein
MTIADWEQGEVNMATQQLVKVPCAITFRSATSVLSGM